MQSLGCPYRVKRIKRLFGLKGSEAEGIRGRMRVSEAEAPMGCRVGLRGLGLALSIARVQMTDPASMCSSLT